jgi:Fe-S-cluster-containing dehydrogenase component
MKFDVYKLKTIVEELVSDMAKKFMIIDLDECTGCQLCVIACKDEHVGNAYPPWTKPQPEKGHFWIRINTIERGEIPKVKVTNIPLLCMHCENAPCIKACPNLAIKRREDGIVWIDPDRCKGSRLCTEACPYGVIYFNEELRIAQKCTWCVHRIDGEEIPRCVDICPHEVFTFSDEDDPVISELRKKSTELFPEFKSKPRVLYIGIPKPFVAGTIVDEALNEVIPECKLVLIDLIDDRKFETVTDEFGDFWFKELEQGHRYMLHIEKHGYVPRTLVITTNRERNLGTIFLQRKT